MTLIVFLFSFLCAKSPDKSIKSDLKPNIQSDSSYIVIRKVEILGNFKTKEKVILRELAIHAGDTLELSKVNDRLERDRQKVFNLNLFNIVKVSLTNRSKTTADVLVEVKERWYYVVLPTFSLTDRNFSDWWYNHNHDFNRVIYGIYASYTNLTGRNDKLRLVAETGFIPNFNLSYTTPYLDKSQHLSLTVGSQYSLDRSLAYRNNYDQTEFINSEKKQRDFYNFYGAISKRQGFYKVHTFEIDYDKLIVADTVAKSNPNYFLNGRTSQHFFLASYTYQYDTRDSKQYALKGARFVLQASKYGLLPSDDINQATISSSFTDYFPLGGRFYANFSVRAKTSLPQRQPFVESVGLGYRTDYVRGYELYVVNGQSYALLKTNLKFQLLNRVFDLGKFLKIRQFNTLPVAAYLNSFLDFGYANNAYATQENSRLGNSLLIGAGLGLDVVSWYNYVGRINYAVNRMGEARIYFSTFKDF